MSKPVLIDLFCGRGGWSKPALARGWECHGFDIIDAAYPGQLHQQPCPIPTRTLAELRPNLILASPPCEEYARRFLPWIAQVGPIDTRLLSWSISLIGTVECPVIVECSHFASRMMPGGKSLRPWHLWGDLPALLPQPLPRKGKVSGTKKARRAEIPDWLASWIIEVFEPDEHKPATRA